MIDIISLFKDSKMNFDDMMNLIVVLHKQYADVPEVVKALEGLDVYILKLKTDGRSVYPVKAELREFFLLILKKYT
jgi:hypothetical protein